MNHSFDVSSILEDDDYIDQRPTMESTFLDDDVTVCEPVKEIIVPVIIAIISAVGLFFNVLVVFTIVAAREYKKSVTNIYVLQLAIADFIFLFQLPFQVNSMVTGKWTYGSTWCKLSESIKLVNYYASIMFLTIMSVDRCLAINFPTDQKVGKLRTKSFAFLMSSLIWVLAILSTIDILKYADVQECRCQIFFPSEIDFGSFEDDFSGSSSTEYEYNGYDYGSGNSTTFHDYGEFLSDNGDSCSYNKAHHPQRFRMWLVCNFVLAFCVPLLVICVSYGLIIRRIVRPTMLGAKSQKSNKTRKRVTIMVTALVSAFIICWLPYHAFHLARLTDVRMSADTCKGIGYFTLILAYSNSGINPFFYTFLGTNFRRRWRVAIGAMMSGFTLKAFNQSGDFTSGIASKRRRSSALSTRSRSSDKRQRDVINGSVGEVSKNGVINDSKQ